jgi:hypothetical protein
MKRLNTKVEREGHYVHGAYRDFHSLASIGTSDPKSNLDRLALSETTEISPFRALTEDYEEARIVCPEESCKAVITRNPKNNRTEIYVDRAGDVDIFADYLMSRMINTLGFEPKMPSNEEVASFALAFYNDAARYLKLVELASKLGERTPDIWGKLQHASFLIFQGVDSKKALSEAGVDPRYNGVL